MTDDFEFIPPAEILSIQRDHFWDSFSNETGGLAFFSVTYACPKGLRYVQSTWAKDELDAYRKVMTGDVMTGFETKEQTNDDT